jgi:hypothetical protein
LLQTCKDTVAFYPCSGRVEAKSFYPCSGRVEAKSPMSCSTGIDLVHITLTMTFSPCWLGGGKGEGHRSNLRVGTIPNNLNPHLDSRGPPYVPAKGYHRAWSGPRFFNGYSNEIPGKVEKL